MLKNPSPPLSQEVFLHWAFRVGFASIFLINGVVGWIDPSSYIKLMQSSFLTNWLPHYGEMTALIALNDTTLGLMLLLEPKNPYILAWAGLWLLGVTLLKVTALV